MTENRDDQINSSSTIQPEKTPLLIGVGMVIRGEIIDETNNPETRMLILGRVEGNIFTKGVVQISKGAVVQAGSVIEAGEIVVSGRLVGENVTVRANVLVLQSTGFVEVQAVILPPGGLEQSRGGVLIARLDMSGVPAAALPVSAATVTAFAAPVTPTPSVLAVTSIHSAPIFSSRPSVLDSDVCLPDDDSADDGADDVVEIAAFHFVKAG